MKHFYYDNKGNLLREAEEPDIEPVPMPPPPPTESEQLRADVDFLAAMAGVAL